MRIGKSKLLILLFCGLLGLSFPTSAWATLETDQEPASEEEIAEAIGNGEIDASASDIQLMSSENGSFAPRSTSYVDSYAGVTRFDTAAMQALAAYDSSDYVIIVGDGGWADALSATGLAGILDCPILLTSKGGLSSQTASAIAQLGAKRAVVLGGPIVISDKVASDLEAMGLQVDSIAGATRQDTQLKIYEYGLSAPNGRTWSSDTVAFASGQGFQDALSFSPVAYADRVPVFLSGSSGALTEAQMAALSGGSYKTSVVLGGPLVMGEQTASFASSIAEGGSCTRLYGQTRYDTSAAVAEWSVKNRSFSWGGAAFAAATLPYDALAGSVLQGKERSVILLTDHASDSTVKKAAQNKGSISSIKFFGGVLSISNVNRLSIVHQLGQRYSVVPGYRVYIDAGHGQNNNNNGAYDPGAISGSYREATLTADLARRVASILRNTYGIDVYLNDDGGYYKYRQSEAEAQGCMTLVSLHFNAGGGTGSESLRHSYNAALNSVDLQSSVHPHLIDGVGLKDRGMKTQQVAVLGGRVPATLLEVCFIDRASDMAAYQSRKDTIAAEIAAGIAAA